MHEMSLVGDVITVANRYASENGAERILKVRLVIGELRDVVDELLVSCFQFLSKDTLAEGAQLEFEKVPLKVRCARCNTVHSADLKDQSTKTCPSCGCTEASIYSGWEFIIDAIEVA